MKRLTAIFLLICIILSGLTVYAADVAKKYTVTYYSDADEEFFFVELMTKTASTVHTVIKDVPQKEGYVFQGWRNSQSNELLQAGQSIKISEATDIFAQWKRENARVLTFLDSGEEILPKQIVLEATATISELVPKQTGRIFVGWSAQGSDEVLKPGQEWEVSQDAELEAVWVSGNLPTPVLTVDSKADGGVTFLLDFAHSGVMSYEDYTVASQNLSTGETRDYEVQNGSISINGLPSGPYRARIVAKKYGIEYFSEWVNFAVFSGKVVPENPLKLVLDGEELIFSETPPALVNSYTYIALRHFCESMGARVEWSDEARSATITLGATVIKVFEKSKKCIVNGTVSALPAETIIMGSRMLLPLRSVAELCSAEIIWDDDRTVYIFRRNESFFEENMVYVQNSKGEYLGADGGNAALRLVGDFDCAWVFDTVDESRGIYEIYSLGDLSKLLQVEDSEVMSGQKLVLAEKGDLDGYLWKVTENSDGSFRIAPLSNPKFSLDAENLCLTEDDMSLNIVHVGNQ